MYLDGEEDRGTEEERRLSNGLGRVHSDGIFGICQIDTEVLWHIVEGRDLVGTGSSCEQHALTHPFVLYQQITE